MADLLLYLFGINYDAYFELATDLTCLVKSKQEKHEVNHKVILPLTKEQSIIWMESFSPGTKWCPSSGPGQSKIFSRDLLSSSPDRIFSTIRSFVAGQLQSNVWGVQRRRRSRTLPTSDQMISTTTTCLALKCHSWLQSHELDCSYSEKPKQFFFKFISEFITVWGPELHLSGLYRIQMCGFY